MEQIIETINSYFNAERVESIFFIVVSIFALATSAYFAIILRKPFFNGIAISLTVVAALQMVVGLTIYYRSPEDAIRVRQMARSAPIRIRIEEIPRMQIVNRNFKIYLIGELTLLTLSVIVAMLSTPGGLIRGAAMGLAIQAFLTATLDMTAAHRGHNYLNWLLSLDRGGI